MKDNPRNYGIRVPIREIPCSQCGTPFGQTQYEKDRKMERCPSCKKLYRAIKNPKQPATKMPKRGRVFEIVLPRSRTPHFDQKKNEWYMKVRTRKRGSNEKLEYDRIYLKVDGSATPGQVEEAFTRRYVSLQMDGYSHKPIEAIKKHRKRIKNIRKDWWSMTAGRDRDMGLTKMRVTRIMYRVRLPDPLVDKKQVFVGRYYTRTEAREAREKAYDELKTRLVPCKVCGRMPVWLKGRLTHISSECENQVQMPIQIRQLFQSKLWNLIYSSGEKKNVGKLTKQDLCEEGFMFREVGSHRFYARTDVACDFSLAKRYARKLDDEEEECTFE